MFVTDSVKYIGVNDNVIDLFEGQYAVPNGISYNSYIIHDSKIAVMDTVDVNFFDEWLKNIKTEIGDKSPDYLIVQHMEPDHSANIFNFMNEYPSAKIVSSAKSFGMMKNFFGTDFSQSQIVVNDGDTLCLGNRTLTFYTAPMVHWPEVIVTYDSADKILFSADGFGKFGTPDTNDDWACEARRYYFGIVGKYGAQVQALLKKASNIDIAMICPLHGPVLKNDLGYYLNLYNIWSSYQSETEGIVIAYTSVYGNTKKAVYELEKMLINKGCPRVIVIDLARCDMSEAVEDAFRYNKLVLATTTYNGEIFPHMHRFILELTERNFQNKKVAFIENGTWAPVANKYMKKLLENSKNLMYTENEVKILSALSEESLKSLELLAGELCIEYK